MACAPVSMATVAVSSTGPVSTSTPYAVFSPPRASRLHKNEKEGSCFRVGIFHDFASSSTSTCRWAGKVELTPIGVELYGLCVVPADLGLVPRVHLQAKVQDRACAPCKG